MFWVLNEVLVEDMEDLEEGSMGWNVVDVECMEMRFLVRWVVRGKFEGK